MKLTAILLFLSTLAFSQTSNPLNYRTQILTTGADPNMVFGNLNVVSQVP